MWWLANGDVVWQENEIKDQLKVAPRGQNIARRTLKTKFQWCGQFARPSLDETSYLVVDDGVADDDDRARNVMTDERHGDHEHRILVRQKHALVVQRSHHTVADNRIQDHYCRRQPDKMAIITLSLLSQQEHSVFTTQAKP